MKSVYMVPLDCLLPVDLKPKLQFHIIINLIMNNKNENIKFAACGYFYYHV